MTARRKSKAKSIAIGLGAATGALALAGLLKKPSSVYRDRPSEQNPMEGKRVRFARNDSEPVNADGVCGHLEAVGEADLRSSGMYEKYIKRAMDIFLSGLGMITLSPVLGAVSLAVYLDDPGPVLFTQKRVGKDKRYFELHKFRSMKMSTPHDVPTHKLENPEQYITRIGGFLRKTSLDELPQLFDIWLGNMSIIGPRPALWNQDVLISEREKYDANSVSPGLTGLAQISGRDELEIEEKARIDGEYVKSLSFDTDLKCFFGTMVAVIKHDGVVEGGTGAMDRSKE